MERENVIKGLETIKQFFEYGLPSTAEMFDSYYGILNDAITLLKEQESVKPVKYSDAAMCLRCGNCGEWLLTCDRFCSNCGKEVKRE